MDSNKEYGIKSKEFWVKIVEMLQQNWALIEESEDDQVVVYFMTDASTVFDKMEFSSIDDPRC